MSPHHSKRILSGLFGLQFVSFFVLISATTLLRPSFASAVDNVPPVQMELQFPDAARHRVEVQVLLPTQGLQEIELYMPNWAPGSYLIRDYARHIESIVAKDALSSEDLPLTKTSTNRWKLSNLRKTPLVRISYRLYCREMSVRTNWVQSDFAVLNGPATFITSPALENRQYLVKYSLPPNWATAHSALSPLDGSPATLVASNWQELIDSPMIFGNPKVAEFELDAKKHRLVTLNDASLWDNEAASKDVQRIVETQQRFWGELPYPHYTFLNVVSESGGGLEHDNSSLLMTGRWSFRDPVAYRRWLGLVSHEFFHVWNVRRLRPKALHRYDLDRPMLFDELWIAEGLTSYYDELLLVRAGLMTEADYLKNLSTSINRVMESPGNGVQSLQDSSRDAWIKFYRPDENDINAKVSYYTKGALVGFVLDAQIRKATRDRKSLDDVMRTLYSRYAGEKGGYTNKDFFKVVDEVAGSPLGAQAIRMIESPGEIDFQTALTWWGLRFGESPEQEQSLDVAQEKGNSKKEPLLDLAPSATASAGKTPYTGAKTRNEAGRLLISQVVLGSPADRAGWNVEDELLAIGGFRATEELLDQRLQLLPTGEPIPAILARRGVLVDSSIVLEPHREDRWALKSDPKATPQQLQQRRLWLAQPTLSKANQK